jgi:DNA primase
MSTAGSAMDPGARSRVDSELLRRTHPIADVVTSYGIELRRVGSALVGRCPFHHDRGQPNLHVYPRSGRWICYRCDQRGDAIGFVQQIENVSFREASASLGGVLPRSPNRPPVRQRKLQAVRPRGFAIAWGPVEYQVLAAATDLYANRLLTDQPALAYMAGRGFPINLLERYRIGFAAGNELIAYLRWRRLPLGAAVRTGLLTDDGREFMSGRITIPELRDGRPIWLIGRVLEDPPAEPLRAGPPYLGLPGQKPLFGWDEAVRDTRGVCVVEGPMDLLALRLWGVPGLALIGTAISPDKLALLDRFERLYLALDQDPAGDAGCARLAAHFGARVVRVRLPTGIKDVGDLARLPNGEDLFREAILASSTLGAACVAKGEKR